MTESLTRFQRVLVGTDGTVTHILEAFAGEAMEVVKLVQAFDTTSDTDAELLAAAGDGVLRRRVILRGRRSGVTFLYADAVVAVDRLPPAVLEGLLDTDKPLGILLAEARAETFREILRVERVPAGSAAAHFGSDPDAELICRTYRIIAGGRPVILITERFPADFFLGLPA